MRALCELHYYQLPRPLPPLLPPDYDRRFWQLVEKGSGCWLWKGYQWARPGEQPYGFHSVNRRPFAAHRYSYRLAHGEIPDGLNVCHHCDVPLCVRPDHLFLGTQGDNIADKVSKKRQARHERDGNAKLTPAEVGEIRRRCIKGDPVNGYRPLGREFGVVKGTIKAVVTMKTWKPELAY